MEKLLQKSSKDVAHIFIVRLGFLAALLLAFLWGPVGLPSFATSRYYNAVISFGSITIVVLWLVETIIILGKTATNGESAEGQLYGEESARPSGILINILIVLLTVFVIMFELPPPPTLFP